MDGGVLAVETSVSDITRAFVPEDREGASVGSGSRALKVTSSLLCARYCKEIPFQ
jgi:hypothetical protein